MGQIFVIWELLTHVALLNKGASLSIRQLLHGFPYDRFLELSFFNKKIIAEKLSTVNNVLYIQMQNLLQDNFE